ncbi:MAG TPA: Gfo/Idh/MocA family oxidoreductase [Spirochaetia bacterium]|nr:Gfo/Idh/MocA family oxidoreductase [Spirochaetia bacterium]
MAARKKVRFGIIGLGLMGREFGSAIARWCHLLSEGPVPVLAGVCDSNPRAHAWFTDAFPDLSIVTTDYHDLLGSSQVDAIYCAVPHNLHEKLYVDIIRAGKHLMGEKPFGIDQAANTAILSALAEKPGLFVRCSSEFPYFPAVQRMIAWIKEGRFGRIMEVRAGFNHSSDMDVTKPINWKRIVEVCGEYGCLGDLGIHTQHVPFRSGWVPRTVYASLSKIVTTRPDGKGGTAPCRTWDNATLCCTVPHADGYEFPMYLETKRMAPGMTNTWFIEVDGLSASARFTSRDPKSFYYLLSGEKEQPWCRLDLGYTPAVPGITGGIFEFGFPDAILQMWASFLLEMESGTPPVFGCFTPEETRISHALQTAALRSNEKKSVEPVIL